MNRSPLRRGKRLRRSNPKRRAAKFERNFTGGADFDHGSYVRKLDCLVCSKLKREQLEATQAAHSRARGMGGAGGTWKALVPLCARCHREQGSIGNRGVLAKYGIDLMAEAERLATEHLAAFEEAKSEAVQNGIVAF